MTTNYYLDGAKILGESRTDWGGSDAFMIMVG